MQCCYRYCSELKHNGIQSWNHDDGLDQQLLQTDIRRYLHSPNTTVMAETSFFRLTASEPAAQLLAAVVNHPAQPGFDHIHVSEMALRSVQVGSGWLWLHSGLAGLTQHDSAGFVPILECWTAQYISGAPHSNHPSVFQQQTVLLEYLQTRLTQPNHRLRAVASRYDLSTPVIVLKRFNSMRCFA
jgi:hypothetical protein